MSERPSESSLDEMLRLVSLLPDQLAESAGFLPELSPLDPSPTGIWLCGMGGSAIAGELLAACGDLGLPWLRVHRGYGLPSFVGSRALLVFSSYSGGTEEVLSAYDAWADAGRINPALVVSSGGALVERANRHGIPVLTLPTGLPPRAALGWSLGALLNGFGALGMATGVAEALTEAETLLRGGVETFRPGADESANGARRLARRLYGKLVLLYAGCPLSAAAASRWKAQINENAKSLAYVSPLPELNHNEITAFLAGSGLPERSFILALRDRAEHPRVHRRFDASREILAASVHAFEDVESSGEGDLARILSLVQMGDYASVYLAEAYGVDPMAIEPIDRLKARLSE